MHFSMYKSIRNSLLAYSRLRPFVLRIDLYLRRRKYNARPNTDNHYKTNGELAKSEEFIPIGSTLSYEFRKKDKVA